MTSATLTGNLTFGHILSATGLEPADVVLLRHTYTADGLQGPEDLTAEKVFEYTRWQGLVNKLGATPPRHWLVFMADGGRRSRLLTAYENHGEIVADRTAVHRCFDLRPSDALAALAGRLVIEWSLDAVNWAKKAPLAASFPLVEIADPERVPFPGFDRVLLPYATLRSVVSDSRYAEWRTALRSVQGIYLITDTSTGRHYVGKADGSERILGRWSAYARDGHGSNEALEELAGIDPEHARHFQFSLLRVYGPTVPKSEIDEAESHFKDALASRTFGLNLN